MNEATDGGTVLICGYYGEHNLGDDALLAVLLQSLPKGWTPIITAHDGQAVRRRHPAVEIVPRRSLAKAIRAVAVADAVVLGGGSLLQDSTSLKSLIYYLSLIATARLLAKPVILWGQGLGPLRRWISRLLVRITLPAVQQISWRDPASLAMAERWGVKVPMAMAADPVWGYAAPRRAIVTNKGRDRVSIVLCWRPTALLDRTTWGLLLEAVDQLSADLDAAVIWLAFHQNQDQSLMDQLHSFGVVPEALLERSSGVVAESLEQVADLFGRARLVLPMRLHALILAQLSDAPCAALSYDPKVAAAAAMAGVDCVDLRALPSPETLVQRWTAQLTAPINRATLDGIRREASTHDDLLRLALQAARR